MRGLHILTEVTFEKGLLFPAAVGTLTLDNDYTHSDPQSVSISDYVRESENIDPYRHP